MIGDVSVTVGSCVGVGFLSGKEAQIFWGNGASIAVFAVIFAICTFAIREFCRATHTATVGEMSAMFAKGATVWQAAIAFCSFVCIVTALAGTEQCLGALLGAPPLPAYAFVAALFAALLSRAGIKALKIADTLSLLLAGAMLAALFAKGGGNSAEIAIPVWQPAVYAVFSVTMTLGTSAKLGAECSQRDNATASLLSALVIAALMCAALPLCNFNAELPALGGLDLPMRAFVSITLLLSAVTGLAANVLPVTELLGDVIPDGTLRIIVIFGFALALSVFGFDFALRAGYSAVAAVGVITVIAAIRGGRRGVEHPTRLTQINRKGRDSLDKAWRPRR